MHTATALGEGRIAIVGGGSIAFGPDGDGHIVPFRGGDGLPADVARLLFHTITALGEGRVLVAGGLGTDVRPTDRAFVLRADAGTFVVEQVLTLPTPRLARSATRVDGGPLAVMVFVTGGFDLNAAGEFVLVDSVDLFLPASFAPRRAELRVAGKRGTRFPALFQADHAGGRRTCRAWRGRRERRSGRLRRGAQVGRRAPPDLR